MNEMPKISVITPLYNSQLYIKDTIESVVNQSFKDFEFILVDDCSTDDSLKIAQEFSARHKFIKVVQNNKNLGISATRNRGLEESSGKYIAFLDNDDLICPNYLEVLYDVIEKEKSDIAICKNSVVISSGKINCNHTPDIKSISTEDRTNGLKDLLTNVIPMPSWAKLFKRELFDHVKFLEDTTCDDIPTVFRLFFYANSISKIDAELLIYRVRPGSASKNMQFKLDTIDAYDYIFRFLKDNNEIDSVISEFTRPNAYFLLYRPVDKLTTDYKELYDEIRKNKKENIRQFKTEVSKFLYYSNPESSEIRKVRKMIDMLFDGQFYKLIGAKGFIKISVFELYYINYSLGYAIDSFFKLFKLRGTKTIINSWIKGR